MEDSVQQTSGPFQALVKVFQALVNEVLCEYLNRFVFVYLDDNLIFSFSLSEHVTHVCRVLQRLLENRLIVKAEFHVPSISFLGYIIESGQVKPDPQKTEAVVEWSRPETCKIYL